MCHKLDEPWGNYTKGNKPRQKRETCHKKTNYLLPLNEVLSQTSWNVKSSGP